MKQLSKVLALILAFAMLAAFIAACGDKKDDDKTDSKTAETPAATAEPTQAPVEKDTAVPATEAPTESTPVTGASQSWGEISVLVPDSMNMQGGNGTLDPEDEQTLWMYNNDNAADYIEVTTKYDEASAKNNIEMSKSVNETYHPEDVSFTAGGEWNGITYDAHGIACTVIYSVSGDKVYYVMIAGYPYDGDVVKTVLESLK